MFCELLQFLLKLTLNLLLTPLNFKFKENWQVEKTEEFNKANGDKIFKYLVSKLYDYKLRRFLF